MIPYRSLEQIAKTIGRNGYKSINELNITEYYNNKDYIVINKPYDLRLEGDFPVTLEKYLKMKYPDDSFSWIHRLDYATSGLLCIAKNQNSASIGCKLFREHRVIKKYEALILGHVTKEYLMSLDLKKISWEYTINNLIDKSEYNPDKMNILLNYDSVTNKFQISCNLSQMKNDFRVFVGTSDYKGKSAVTDFILGEESEYLGYPTTHVTLFLHTGRRHQLRLHMCCIGSPIIGDGTYGIEKNTNTAIFPRMMLHSSYLKLLFNEKERIGSEMEFESSPSFIEDDFK